MAYSARGLLRPIAIAALLAIAVTPMAADTIVNLSSLSHGSDYTYTPTPLFSPTSINNAGQVLGTFGYVLSPGFVTYENEIYSGGTVTNIGSYYNGAILTSLNDFGQAVGVAFGPSSFENAIVYSGGQYQYVGGTRNSFAVAYGINDNGQIVGSYSGEAFLYSGGGLINITSGTAYAINAAGEVAGVTANSLFTYANGRVTNLGTAGSGIQNVAGVNASGQIAGNFAASAGSFIQNGFLYASGTFTVLPTLGGATSSVGGINDNGQVVGCSSTASGTSDAFVYSGGVMTDLNALLPANSGWSLTCATGINDAGQIIGNGIFAGQSAGFLLNPETTSAAPEPASVLLTVLGSAWLVIAGVRKAAIGWVKSSAAAGSRC